MAPLAPVFGMGQPRAGIRTNPTQEALQGHRNSDFAGNDSGMGRMGHHNQTTRFFNILDDFSIEHVSLPAVPPVPPRGPTGHLLVVSVLLPGALRL